MRRTQTCIFASKGQRIDEVVEPMRKHGISQMPVNDSHGSTVGMIHEYDLLNALVAEDAGLPRPHRPAHRAAPGRGESRGQRCTALREVFAQDNVAVVKEREQVVAIVTKIDLIEFLAARM